MALDQQINLRWNNHTNNMLEIFMEQLKNEKLVDCTLSSQGQFLKAHKVVLSACSPYFQDLFKNHQSSNPVIIFNGISFLDLKLVVEFMYQGEIKVLEAELEGLLAAAETLQVKGLTNIRNKCDKREIQEDAPVPVSDPVPVLVSASKPEKRPKLRKKRLALRKKQPEPEHRQSRSPIILRRKRQKTSSSPSSSNVKPHCSIETDNSASDDSPSKFAKSTRRVKSRFTNGSNLYPSMKIKAPEFEFVDVFDTKTMSNDDDEEGDIAGWETPKIVVDMQCDVSNAVNGKSGIISRTLRTRKVAKDQRPYRTRSKLQRRKKKIKSESSNTSEEGESVQVMEWVDKHGSKIRRPPNAFMIFGNEWRSKLANKYPDETNKQISVRLGIMWKSLDRRTKERYYRSSQLADAEHKRKYPGYYYSPAEARMRKLLRAGISSARVKSEPKHLRASISGIIGRSGRWKKVGRNVDKEQPVDKEKPVDKTQPEDWKKLLDKEQWVDGEKSMGKEQSVDKEKPLDKEKPVQKEELVDMEKSVEPVCKEEPFSCDENVSYSCYIEPASKEVVVKQEFNDSTYLDSGPSFLFCEESLAASLE